MILLFKRVCILVVCCFWSVSFAEKSSDEWTTVFQSIDKNIGVFLDDLLKRSLKSKFDVKWSPEMDPSPLQDLLDFDVGKNIGVFCDSLAKKFSFNCDVSESGRFTSLGRLLGFDIDSPSTNLDLKKHTQNTHSEFKKCIHSMTNRIMKDMLKYLRVKKLPVEGAGYAALLSLKAELVHAMRSCDYDKACVVNNMLVDLLSGLRLVDVSHAYAVRSRNKIYGQLFIAMHQVNLSHCSICDDPQSHGLIVDVSDNFRERWKSICDLAVRANYPSFLAKCFDSNYIKDCNTSRKYSLEFGGKKWYLDDLSFFEKDEASKNLAFSLSTRLQSDSAAKKPGGSSWRSVLGQCFRGDFFGFYTQVKMLSFEQVKNAKKILLQPKEDSTVSDAVSSYLDSNPASKLDPEFPNFPTPGMRRNKINNSSKRKGNVSTSNSKKTRGETGNSQGLDKTRKTKAQQGEERQVKSGFSSASAKNVGDSTQTRDEAIELEEIRKNDRTLDSFCKNVGGDRILIEYVSLEEELRHILLDNVTDAERRKAEVEKRQKEIEIANLKPLVGYKILGTRLIEGASLDDISQEERMSIDKKLKKSYTPRYLVDRNYEDPLYQYYFKTLYQFIEDVFSLMGEYEFSGFTVKDRGSSDGDYANSCEVLASVSQYIPHLRTYLFDYIGSHWVDSLSSQRIIDQSMSCNKDSAFWHDAQNIYYNAGEIRFIFFSDQPTGAGSVSPPRLIASVLSRNNVVTVPNAYFCKVDSTRSLASLFDQESCFLSRLCSPFFPLHFMVECPMHAVSLDKPGDKICSDYSYEQLMDSKTVFPDNVHHSGSYVLKDNKFWRCLNGLGEMLSERIKNGMEKKLGSLYDAWELRVLKRERGY